MNIKKLVGIMLIAFVGSIIGVFAYSLLVKPKVTIIQEMAESPAHLTSLPSGGLETADFSKCSCTCNFNKIPGTKSI